jgi:precorrin-2/cobalt-factor-2 C20-methyltransferase
MVLRILRDMGISEHCALAARIGLPGETVCDDLSTLPDSAELGYLSTMLIRRAARKQRHL